MSENDNQQSLTSSLCKNGCGFFGSSQFDGMCSVCYKETLKKKQKQDEEQIQAGRSTSPLTSGLSCASTATAPSLPATFANLDTGSDVLSSSIEVPGPLDAGGQPTVTTIQSIQDANTDDSTNGSDNSDVASSKSRKNRCSVCKKKVGLTGFTCRCNGLFCSLHRYSDKHDCNFDYQTLGQEEIRKANPQVVSSKVEKL